MRTAVWVACGALAAVIAWYARPHRYPGGPATAFAAGLCGGFLGGAAVILIAGRDALPSALSIYGALVGTITLLDLTERASSAPVQQPGHPTLAGLWSWTLRFDPALLAILAAATTGTAFDSPLAGIISGAGALALTSGQRHRAAFLTRQEPAQPSTQRVTHRDDRSGAPPPGLGRTSRRSTAPGSS
jgi:uncharacterized membrane protein YeaQ/YmgE (transglycosylase-associated protein family)